ncbi:MAG: amidohydrolase [Ilumatobacter sp.]|uniref:amidohydrolase family protein n=1 Tax=Ilumatobacter sp. TaxID=1967498 RepID=UPI0026203021|nr:amidohydrolase [Ilumatobacter sp.]MDJ0767281.1 amidohydrolase [Ilumatobacter sp.]
MNDAATTLVTGGAVVTVDDEFTIHDPGWVAIDGRRIAAVGAGEPPPELAATAGEVVDATGCAVMPGMVNAHTHLFQTFFRGLGDDKPLLDWLRDYIWPGAQHFDPEIAYHAAKVGIVENLRGGATTVIDHQYVHTGERAGEIDDAVCRAADELGVRFLLAHGWADSRYPDAMIESADVAIERAGEMHAKWDGHDDGRMRVEMAPLIPWGCSDDAMRATVAASRSWGRGTHIHCAETKAEVDMSLEDRGLRHIPWLYGLGVLGPDMQLAHSIWLDDDELDVIAETGSIVVHCPVSNMYLASGVARIVEMRERGITIALASDGPGSNNRQDMFEVLKSTVLLQKVHRLDAMALQPEDALHMACRGGAAAFGTPDDLGSIEPGRRADLLVVELTSPFVAPVHRVPSALVFNAMPHDVRHVVVDGRFRLRDGVVPGIDDAVLADEGRQHARALFGRAGLPLPR